MIQSPVLLSILISGTLQAVPEGFHHPHKSKGVAVATDLDEGVPGKYVLPAPSTAGALAAPSPLKDKEGKPATNGAAHAMDKDEQKRWVERTGWAPRFGDGEPVEAESFADHQTWIESKLADKFYGGRFAGS